MLNIKKIGFIIFILSFHLGNAQIDSTTRKLDRYIAFGPSTAAYKGDLNENYSKIGGGVNIMIIPERDKLIQSTIELNFGRVTGENANYYSEEHPQFEPNTFFETNFVSFSFNIRAYLYRKNNWKVYIGQGIGAIRFSPKNEFGEKLDTITSSRYSNTETGIGESYGNLALILPRSIGVSYKFKNEYRINLDVNQQAPRTDYIDNIGTLGISKKKDKILLVRFSVMIPLIYKPKNGKKSSSF